MSLTSPVISIGESSYSVINIIILICLFFGLVAVAGAVTNLLRSRVLRITTISRGVQESIAIVIHLRKQNIQIPFPQRSLHLRSGSLPLKVSPKVRKFLVSTF
jgi:small-conductance mechanosensitive channel